MNDVSPDTLMRQASMTAHDYLIYAIENVEKEGIPKEQQGVVIAACIIAASIDYTGSLMAVQLQNGLEGISGALVDQLYNMTGAITLVAEAIDASQAEGMSNGS